MDMILVVDDNKDMCRILSDILSREGYRVMAANDAKAAMKALARESPDLVLLDRKLPDMDGLKALEEMRQSDECPAIIMLTAYGDVQSAVMAMKLGAFDYITKPFDEAQLCLVIRKAIEMRRLTKRVPVCLNPGEDMLVRGSSPRIKQVLKQTGIVAPTKMTVILKGESGVGKELIARLIHQRSPRKDKPFIAIDCGTLQETLDRKSVV